MKKTVCPSSADLICLVWYTIPSLLQREQRRSICRVRTVRRTGLCSTYSHLQGLVSPQVPSVQSPGPPEPAQTGPQGSGRRWTESVGRRTLHKHTATISEFSKQTLAPRPGSGDPEVLGHQNLHVPNTRVNHGSGPLTLHSGPRGRTLNVVRRHHRQIQPEQEPSTASPRPEAARLYLPPGCRRSSAGSAPCPGAPGGEQCCHIQGRN